MVTTSPTRSQGQPRSQRYRLSARAVVTAPAQTGSSPREAYVKNRDTGALFRMGVEEYQLLSILAAGLSPQASARKFRDALGMDVDIGAVEGFADQMVTHGVLVPEDDQVGSAEAETATTDGGPDYPVSVDALQDGVAVDGTILDEKSELAAFDADDCGEDEDMLGDDPLGDIDFDVGTGLDDMDPLNSAAFRLSAEPDPDPDADPLQWLVFSDLSAQVRERGHLPSRPHAVTSDAPSGASDAAIAVDDGAHSEREEAPPPTRASETVPSTEVGADDAAAEVEENDENTGTADADGETPQHPELAGDDPIRGWRGTQSRGETPETSSGASRPAVGLYTAQSRDGEPASRRAGASRQRAPRAAPTNTERGADTGHADPRVADRKLRFKDAKAAARPSFGMHIRLFDPTRLLRVLNSVLRLPARLLARSAIPVTLLALLSVFHQMDEVIDGIARLNASFNVLGLLLLSLVTVNLVSRLTLGAVAQREGADVRHFGIVFLFFLVPRFAIDGLGVVRLSREAQMRVFASALRSRMLVFAIATLAWAMSRQSATGFPQLALILGQMGLLSLLITAFPGIKAEGYRFLCAYLNQPQLSKRAMSYVFGIGRKDGAPPTGFEKRIFVLYVLGMILFLSFVVVLLGAYVSTALEGRFGGTGVLMFLGILALIAVWMRVMQGQKKALAKQLISEIQSERRAERARASATGQTLPAVTHSTALVQRPSGLPAVRPGSGLSPYQPLPGRYAGNTKTARRSVWLRRAIGAVAFAGAVWVALLSYDYEVGGSFTILPDERVKVVARAQGELIAVHVDEGDVVAEGDLLAVLDGVTQRHALVVSRAELAKARAQLETMIAGATPEEVRVAEEAVARAEAHLPFLESEAERARELLARGAIPGSEAERRLSAFEAGVAELRAAEANLAQVRADAQESEVAAVQADVDRLEAIVAYNESQLAATEIHAPVDGRIVVDGEMPVRGRYLEVGETLFEIEDHRVARAEIRVSETDIGLVEVGEPVRLKAWARPDEERTGVVTALAPVAETEEFGQVVRIRTELPNENGFFRPGMTGFAKIDGEEMRVWEAYSRLLVRFVLIEIWGWIP